MPCASGADSLLRDARGGDAGRAGIRVRVPDRGVDRPTVRHTMRRLPSRDVLDSPKLHLSLALAVGGGVLRMSWGRDTAPGP